MTPKHLRQIPENRQAIAPYNFVELPDQIVEVTEHTLPKSNCYEPKRHTGKIQCTLTTSSPLYIRCGLTTEEFKDGEEAEAKDLPDFFYTDPTAKTQKPVIPGSSLRGMLRMLVEIISFSKIERVSDRQHFFFRAVATTERDDSLAQAYKQHINPQNVKAGYLKKEGDRWFVCPAKSIKGVTFAWVKEENLSTADFTKMDECGYLPQYIPVSFRDINKNKNNRFFADDVSQPNTHPMNNGTLVSSGNMKQSDDPSTKTTRRNHCIVFQQSPSQKKLEIDPFAIQHYCDALTDFQKSNPFDGNLGVLQDSRPIFYCQPPNGKLVNLFGQSPNFRIPYSPKNDGKAASAVDFIPDGLGKSDKIDLADAIFGFIKDKQPGEKQAKARSGRVFISDGICDRTTCDDIWLSGNTIIPKILASPKPTTFQHYLVQSSHAKNALKHYASKPEEDTTIRGHKLYWHQGSSPAIQHENPDDVSDTQTTQIKPIKPGVDFQFTVDFENLTNIELGALLWVLDIAQDEKYRLSLGMGKPLGMGAVKIESKLYLSKRNRRYSSLFEGLKWALAEDFEAHPDYQRDFENYVQVNIRQTGNFRDIERIQMLLAMLSWQDSPSANKTRYMEIKRQQQPLDGDPNEYKTRRVLPTPLQVIEKPGGSRPVRRPSTPPQNQELPRITTSPPVKLPLSEQANTFCNGQIVEATILEIVTKVIDSKKTKTTITYEVNGSKLGKTEEIYKKSVPFTLGDVIELRITEVRNGVVKKYERLEQHDRE